MDGWTNEWNELMDGWKDRETDRCTDRQVDILMNGPFDRWIDRQEHGGADRHYLTDVQMNAVAYFYTATLGEQYSMCGIKGLHYRACVQCKSSQLSAADWITLKGKIKFLAITYFVVSWSSLFCNGMSVWVTLFSSHLHASLWVNRQLLGHHMHHPFIGKPRTSSASTYFQSPSFHRQ